MKDFRTWMNLRESAPVGGMKTAYGDSYHIEHEGETVKAVVAGASDGEEVDAEVIIDELRLGNDYVHGKAHVSGTYGEEHYDEGGMMAGVSIDQVIIDKSEIEISNDEGVGRTITDEDMTNIMIQFMSSKSSLDHAMRKLEQGF